MGMIRSNNSMFFATINGLQYNAEHKLPGNQLMPGDKMIMGMHLEFSGRITISGANGPTATTADGIFGLIQQIRVEGFHRKRQKNEVWCNLRGSDLNALVRMCLGQVQYMEPSLGAPLYTQNMNIGANQVNDFKFSLYLPFAPLGIPFRSQLGFALDAFNVDQLTLIVKTADDKSVFSGQTVTQPMTAYGSTTGSAKVDVSFDYALESETGLRNVSPGMVARYQSDLFTDTDLQNNGIVTNSKRLYVPPKGNALTRVLMKTGVKAAQTTGNDAFASYTDTCFSNIRFNLGSQRPIRRYATQLSMRNEIARANGLQPPPGFCMFDFIRSLDSTNNGQLSQALALYGMVAGSTANTDVYLEADVLGSTGLAASFIVEELRGVPDWPKPKQQQQRK